jgi:hypothetical protein
VEWGNEFDVDGTGRVVWRATIPTPTRRLIRRLRQCPHLSAEEAWLFYAEFCVDCETGVGLSTGQGSNPQLMLQWSKDGGHTWSGERWVSAGRQGHYAWRATWRRLGRTRDMVFRVVVADPVKWAMVDAYVEVERGLS